MKIEALHEFHDKDFAEGWAERFTPTPERLSLFQTILDQILLVDFESIHIIELGIGPGYLAEFLLSRLDAVSYEGVDFSEPMLEIASNRLQAFTDRVNYTQADLTQDSWTDTLKQQAQVIVSTWALHDLFNADNILSVYQHTYNILPEKGIFLNGDFVKPEESPFEYEEGRIKPSIHIDLLQSVGFGEVKCLKEFEKEVMNPTTANNYACFMAVK